MDGFKDGNNYFPFPFPFHFLCETVFSSSFLSTGFDPSPNLLFLPYLLILALT